MPSLRHSIRWGAWAMAARLAMRSPFWLPTPRGGLLASIFRLMAASRCSALTAALHRVPGLSAGSADWFSCLALKCALWERGIGLAFAIENLLNGLQCGLMLFLLAAGLTLVFGIMDVVNLAHGSLYMAGAY